MKNLSIISLLLPGDMGDTSIDLRLTAREIAAVQYVLSVAIVNTDTLKAAAAGAVAAGVGRRWSIAFQSAQLRLAVALARAFRPEQAAEFSALLAQVDQDQSALDHEEEV